MSSSSKQDPSQALPPETFLDLLSLPRDSKTIARSSGVSRRWRTMITSSLSLHQNLTLDLAAFFGRIDQALDGRERDEWLQNKCEKGYELFKRLSELSGNRLVTLELVLSWYLWDQLLVHNRSFEGSQLQKTFDLLLLSKSTLQRLSLRYDDHLGDEWDTDKEWIFLIDFLENFQNLKEAELIGPSPIRIKTQRLTIEPTSDELLIGEGEVLPLVKRATRYGGKMTEFSLWKEPSEDNNAGPALPEYPALVAKEAEFLQELMLHQDTLEVLDLVSLLDFPYQKALDLVLGCPKLVDLKLSQPERWYTLSEGEKLKFEIHDFDFKTSSLTRLIFRVGMEYMKITWNPSLINWIGEKLEILHLGNASDETKLPFMPLEPLILILKSNSHCLKEVRLENFYLEKEGETKLLPSDSSPVFLALQSLKFYGAHDPKIIRLLSYCKFLALSEFIVRIHRSNTDLSDPETFVNLSDLERFFQASSNLTRIDLKGLQARNPTKPSNPGITLPNLSWFDIEDCCIELFRASLSFKCPKLRSWDFVISKYNQAPPFSISSSLLQGFLHAAQDSIRDIDMAGINLEESAQAITSQPLTFPSLGTIRFKRVNDSLIDFFSLHSYPSLTKLQEKKENETFRSIFGPRSCQCKRCQSEW